MTTANHNPNQYGGRVSRGGMTIRAIAAKDGEKSAGYEVIASTASPVQVVDWERWQVVREILPTRYCELPTTDRVPLLDSHERDSVSEDLLGSATGWRIDGDTVLARVGVSSAHPEIDTKIREGHIDSVSIGYRTYPDATIEIPRNASVLVDGVEYRNDFTDAMPLLVRTRWSVHELSLVAIGADDAAKFRAKYLMPQGSQVPVDPLVGVGRGVSSQSQKQEVIMSTPTETPQGTTAQGVVQDRAAPIAPTPTPIVSQTIDHAGMERARASEILAIGREFNLGDEAQKAVADGTSIDGFRQAALAAIKARQSAPKLVMGSDFLTPQEMSRYSLFSAIRAATKNDWTHAGFEREVSRHLEKATGKDAQGFIAPYEVIAGDMGRTMSVGLGTQPADGGGIVATELRADMFIDMLRARTVLGQVGAQFMTGLVGNLDIPRLVSGASFGWIAEAGNPTEVSPTVGKISLSPKTAVARVDITRRLLQQSTPAAEQLVRNDLSKAAMLTIDNAGLNGTAASNQPRGLVNTSGVLTQTIATAGAPTWAEVVAMEGKVDQANALQGTLAYVCTPAVASTMKSTPKVANAAVFVNEDGFVNGYRVLTTTQATKIIFGDFSNLMIAMWGAMDIVPDTSTLANSGGLTLRVFLDMDVGVRYPVGFCINA